jgi:penicillin-binding protein 2
MEKSTSRLRVLALLVVLMFLALSTRLWFLQVLATQRFDKEARSNSVRLVYKDPIRGRILDAEGRDLVVNQSSLELRITPDLLGDQGEAVVLSVSRLTGVPVRQIARELQDTKYVSSQSIPVAEFVPNEVQYFIREHPQQFPGVQVVETSVRSYPFGRMAAHLFGYVHLIDKSRYEALKGSGYGPNDMVGFGGLEESYELYLHGEQGKTRILVNADGETIRKLFSTPPTTGDDLHLTLSAHIQHVAEQALLAGMARARAYHDANGNALRADAGAVVVLDANTGGVVAMASEPGYNPAWYVHGLTPPQTKYLFKNTRVAASLNRATQADYAPGSTFKPITALAAVKEGIASLSGYYPCTSQYKHPGDTSGAVFHNWEPSNTTLSIADALQVSCDTVFDRFGSAFYTRWLQNDPLGEDILERDLHQWGFEQPTGIDLPAEVTGLVPDPAWASTRPDLFENGAWIPGGDILTMIGSGYVQVTPLQLARAYAAIANGGHLCQPHLVDEITGPDGSLVKRVTGHCDQTVPDITAQQLGYIRGALRSVVTGGTAFCAFQGFPFSQLAVAGKTGTAEREPGKQDTSWFGAMVGPDPDHPEYVIVTMVEQGGFGGQTAAPITRQVIDGLYPNIGDASHPSCTTPDR